MSFLVDTNVCIAGLNGRPVAVVEKLAKTLARRNAVAVSAVTLFELQYGIAKSLHVDRNRRTLDAFLVPLQVIPFEDEDARLAGDIRAGLERVGTPIGPYDYLIAAQAVRHKLRLVTANTREFSRVNGLRWEDWTK